MPAKKKRRRAKSFAATLEDIHTYLDGENKASLVALLLERAAWDDDLREALALRAAVRDADDGDEVVAGLDRAFEVDGFLSRGAARAYARRIDAAVDVLDKLLAEGGAAAVVTLAEHALTRIEEAFGNVDDSDGHLGDVRDRLLALHLRACSEARPEPIALARRLFARELASQYDVFHGAAEAYASILGPEGLEDYRRLAKEQWKKVPALGPGEADPNKWGARFRLTWMMKSIARADGDIEGEAAVLKHDLSHAYDFLKVAEHYQRHGKPDLALAWAEKGIAAFPERTDPRLCAFVADAYHRAGRHDEAMAIAWAQFAEAPTAERYPSLKENAERAGVWPLWRERALGAVRKAIAARKREAKASRWVADSGHSPLVEIHLLAGDVETAWQEAQAGGCTATLWRKLAEAREKTHPGDALPLYQREVDAIVRLGNNDSYARAVALLQRIARVMARMESKPPFLRYLEEVRRTHAAKRNFMRLLDGATWAET